MNVTPRSLLICLAIGIPASISAHQDHVIEPVPAAAVAPTAPGYGSLGFEAPKPGTYALPSLGVAADGIVLDGAGTPRHLHDLMSGHTVLLSFIYTSCNDVNGCPLATYVLGLVQTPISAHPLLKDRVRLLSLSFDPARDTREKMQEYGNRFRQAGFDWQFLTTAGNSDLHTILDAYGQLTLPERDAEGRVTGNLAHLLRVYLIDEQLRIRNIYNANFLHPEILVNDILTVLEGE